MAWEYSKKTMDIFTAALQGKPGTHIGEIENPDGRGEHGSIACGDALLFTFKVQRDENNPINDKIVETKYLTFGCTSAIAASEALCCIIEERQFTPIESLSITNQDIADFLDGLPDQKIHCSVMGAEALAAAVFDWAQKRNVNLAKLGIDIQADEQEEGRIVCKCFTLTEPYIKRKIKELSLRTVPEIASAIKAGGACMSCHHAPGGLQDLLNEVWGTQAGATQTPAASHALPILNMLPSADSSTPRRMDGADDSAKNLSPFQFAKKIEKILNEYVRPMLQRDGGDLELVDIKEMIVYVELRGACESCASAGQTLKNLVERTLKGQVDDRIRVVQV